MSKESAILRNLSIAVLAVLGGWLLPAPALAVQEHGIYWLRQRRLVREPGWRCIQYAALFFILWNLDAFAAHFLDEQADILDTLPAGFGRLRIEIGDYPAALAWFYYIAKLDHLLCVPAMLFLYAGLRRLLKDEARGREGAESP